MTAPKQPNPFDYGGANNLSAEQVANLYIADFNYAELIRSNRNVLLLGERGAGKTMMLRYYSWPVRRIQATVEALSDIYAYIGVLVPCATPILERQEHTLLGDVAALRLSEHYLALVIGQCIIRTIIDDGKTEEAEASLKDDVEYVLGISLPSAETLFLALDKFLERELVQTQQRDNQLAMQETYRYWSFGSLIVPILSLIRKIPRFSESHFMLMIDDAHSLNRHHQQALNSWIAYRDRTVFSIKMASAKVGRPSRHTPLGGEILEGHDFIEIDMEQPVQTPAGGFPELASRIINRRLERAGISATSEEFFPVHPELERKLEEARIAVRREAEEKYPGGTSKQINDYIYKYSRPRFFRDLAPKANVPQYSGFSTLVALATGVVRNLLEPCSTMYELQRSRDSEQPQQIAPTVQADVIDKTSTRLWERLRYNLQADVSECTADDAERIYHLFDRLAQLFQVRLRHHQSEPGALAFTISGPDDEDRKSVEALLKIAQRAQLVYVRLIAAKDNSRRERYYIPNRMLWPARKLDPQAQHARIQLPAGDLINAANNKPFPFVRQYEGKPLGFVAPHDPDLFGGNPS